MLYNCTAMKNLSGQISSIILFGIPHKVVPYKTREAQSAIKRLTQYCSAVDSYGNVYAIYTDYDPCLRVSETVAILVEEGGK